MTLKNIKKNHYYAHYLSKEEFEKVVKSGKRAFITYQYSLIIEPIEYFDRFSFYGYILEPSEEQADFLIFDTNQNWRYVSNSSLRSRTYAMDYYDKIPGAFTYDGVTFFKLTEIRPMPGNEAQFFFRQTVTLYTFEKDNIFMIMPFGNKELNAFYENNIRNFLRDKASLKVIRADDFADNDVIIDTIMSQIEKAEIILCEITVCNKNVFFEIGYARGMDKEMIFISQKSYELKFFDVNHIRRIEYEINRPVVFQERLLDTIKSIRNRIK